MGCNPTISVVYTVNKTRVRSLFYILCVCRRLLWRSCLLHLCVDWLCDASLRCRLPKTSGCTSTLKVIPKPIEYLIRNPSMWTEAVRWVKCHHWSADRVIFLDLGTKSNGIEESFDWRSFYFSQYLTGLEHPNPALDQSMLCLQSYRVSSERHCITTWFESEGRMVRLVPGLCAICLLMQLEISRYYFDTSYAFSHTVASCHPCKRS